MNTIQSVIKNDYCIGCGSCSVTNNNFNIVRNEYGILTAQYNATSSNEEIPKDLSEICPFSSTENETTLSYKKFSHIDNIKYEKRLGYYLDLYSGHINNLDLRKKTSSGGLLTWLLQYLLEHKIIDGVIHVKESEKQPTLFEYTISSTIEEISSRSKSRYYHVSFDDIKDFLNSKNLTGKYVFVGVPCYIKAMRLLCETNTHLKKHIIYFFGLFCGHMKSSAFSELLAWQNGIQPNNLLDIDFRVKNTTGLSSRYSININKHQQNIYAQNSKLYGTDWGLGFFKPKACDWCDDVSAELADITFGDAWLPEYINDSLGTNIVIVRNQLLNQILIELKNDNITLNSIPIEKVISSQAGNYRHRQEGLSIRIARAEQNQQWYPKKRIVQNEYNVSTKRKNLYLIREEISRKSHSLFLQAKKRSNISWFTLRMLPLEIKYHYYNNNLIKGSLKTILKSIKIWTYK